jgi:N-acetylmuramate 1-kinase
MTDSVRPRIDRYLAETGLAQQGAKAVPLTGDASDRRYLRILLRDAPSQVLAVYPQAFDVEQLPFANVASLMAAMPVPVPAILGHSNELGILALEDLGDVTLIARMQQRGRDLASDRYLPYGIAFDVEKLSWELQFFVKHFLEAYRGAALTPAGREALGVELLRIAEELAAEPRVFCHRDYHSRNLMLHAGQLYIIDFQDARMGPDTYDLVSLLRDSYMDFSEREVDELIAFFLALRGVGAERGGTGNEAGVFRRRFDLMALQRNLKALGTFGFQAATRGNPVYIQYIPRTIAYVRHNVERDSRFWRLREILSAHMEELR